MKITELFERIVEGNPKVCNVVYVDTSSKIGKQNFEMFEIILSKYVNICDVTKVTENRIDDYGMTYTYQIRLNNQRKFMRELQLQGLDLIYQSFDMVRLVNKK